MRRIAVAVALLALIGAACGSNNDNAGTATEAPSAGPQTRTVLVDSVPPGVGAGHILKYFPDEVALRPGDTANFKLVWTGEPHSVTMGTVVDAVIPKAKAVAPDATPPADLEKAFEALPVMLPEGPGDANQIAANPCYIETGTLPADAKKPCPTVAQPAFNGRQAYYSSGFLEPGKDFAVKLADDIKPGDYYFYCNLHGAEMSGYIEVKDKDASIPTQATLDKEAKDQIAKAAGADLAGSYKDAQAGKAEFQGNLAGFGTEGSEAGVNEFIPKDTKIKVGETVTWTILGPHTITFNPPAGVTTPMQKAPDGAWHLSAKVMAPAGGPGMPGGPPPATTGTPAPGLPKPKNVNGGKFDGAGFRSSGFFISFPDAPGSFFSYSLTFTKAGTFAYQCLIHPPMVGTVQVT